MRFRVCPAIPPLLAVLLLSSCAMFGAGPWPDGAPPRAFFEQYYASDAANQARQSEAAYLGWVERFYTGVDPVPGWLEMSRQVLEALAPPRRAEVETRLYELGRRMSAEWARDNAVRQVDTRMANVWRDALLEARAQDDIPEFLERVDADIDGLLAGELAPDVIRFERYYIDDFEF